MVTGGSPRLLLPNCDRRSVIITDGDPGETSHPPSNDHLNNADGLTDHGTVDRWNAVNSSAGSETHDALAGSGLWEVAIEEPAILDLIGCPTFQRLKGVRQAGPSALAFPFKDVTRFEHSLGVFILLRRLRRRRREQVAGLLHDISHTAFSHAVDFVFSSDEQDHHEQLKPLMLDRPTSPRRSGAPGLLRRPILRRFDLSAARAADPLALRRPARLFLPRRPGLRRRDARRRRAHPRPPDGRRHRRSS